MEKTAMVLARKFTVLLSLALFFPYSANAADSAAQILSQSDGRTMHMECMNLVRMKKINTPDVHACRLECGKYIKMFSNDFNKFEQRAELSQTCRSHYKDATGKDMLPTISRNYVPPKGSAR